MKKSALGAIWRLAQANVVLSGATFATGVVLAHALGPEGRGELATLLLWPTLMCHLALLGIHLHLARETAREPVRARDNYWLGFWALGASSTLALLLYGAAVFLAWHLGGWSVDFGLAIAAGLLMPTSIWNAFQMQMELGRQNTSAFILVRYCFALIYLVQIVAIWSLGWASVSAFIVAFIAASFLTAAGAQWVIARTLPAAAPGSGTPPGLAGMRHLLAAARPYGISVALNALSSTVDKIMVSVFFDARTMGQYVVAVAIGQLQNLLGEAISQIFFAKMAQLEGLSGVDPKWLALRLRQSTIIYALSGGLIMLIASPLVHLVFGGKFSASVDLLYMLIPSLTLIAAKRPFEEILKAGGLPMVQARISLIATAIFAAAGGVAAWLGGVAIMLLVFFLVSMLAFILIARAVAQEIGADAGDLLMPRPGDLVQLISQAGLRKRV